MNAEASTAEVPQPPLHVAIGYLRGSLIVIPIPHEEEQQPLCSTCLVPIDGASCALCASIPEILP